MYRENNSGLYNGIITDILVFTCKRIIPLREYLVSFRFMASLISYRAL